MNKTDQILECTLSFFSFLPPPFFWLPTLSGNCSVEQRVLWMKDWYEETWMSTQALKDSLLMKYSKSHFQGGWKFSVMCTNAFDKKNYIYQIITEVLALGTKKIRLVHMHPNIMERFIDHILFPLVKMIRHLTTLPW